MPCGKFVLRNVISDPLCQKSNQAWQRRKDSIKWLGMTCLIISCNDQTAILFISCSWLMFWKHKCNQCLSSKERQGRARYRAIVYFYVWVNFLETTLFSGQDGHETTTSEATNRPPHDCVCFRLFPFVSTCGPWRFPDGAVHHRDPCPKWSGGVQKQFCSSGTAACQRLRLRERGDVWVQVIATLRQGIHSRRAAASCKKSDWLVSSTGELVNKGWVPHVLVKLHLACRLKLYFG